MEIFEELVEENIYMKFMTPELYIRVQHREPPVLIRVLIPYQVTNNRIKFRAITHNGCHFNENC